MEPSLFVPAIPSWCTACRSFRFFELPTWADTGNCSVERPCFLWITSGPPVQRIAVLHALLPSPLRGLLDCFSPAPRVLRRVHARSSVGMLPRDHASVGIWAFRLRFSLVMGLNFSGGGVGSEPKEAPGRSEREREKERERERKNEREREKAFRVQRIARSCLCIE